MNRKRKRLTRQLLASSDATKMITGLIKKADDLIKESRKAQAELFKTPYKHFADEK